MFSFDIMSTVDPGVNDILDIQLLTPPITEKEFLLSLFEEISRLPHDYLEPTLFVTGEVDGMNASIFEELSNYLYVGVLAHSSLEGHCLLALLRYLYNNNTLSSFYEDLNSNPDEIPYHAQLRLYILALSENKFVRKYNSNPMNQIPISVELFDEEISVVVRSFSEIKVWTHSSIQDYFLTTYLQYSKVKLPNTIASKMISTDSVSNRELITYKLGRDYFGWYITFHHFANDKFNFDDYYFDDQYQLTKKYVRPGLVDLTDEEKNIHLLSPCKILTHLTTFVREYDQQITEVVC